MIVAGKINHRVTLWRLPPDTLVPAKLTEVWASWRAKPDEGIVPGFQLARAPTGLLDPNTLEMRLRYRSDLQVGDYVTWDGRLAHIFSLRDPNGKNAELIASCHEMIGHAATYTPAGGGTAIATRAFLNHDSPYIAQISQRIDYRVRIELPIFGVGRAAPQAKVTINTTTYTLLGLIEQGDDGTVRAYWGQK
jgi:hypothetical protein